MKLNNNLSIVNLLSTDDLHANTMEEASYIFYHKRQKIGGTKILQISELCYFHQTLFAKYKKRSNTHTYL